MSILNNRKYGAIILAAGKGKRMQLNDKSKVTLPLGDKSIILHIVHFIKSLNIENIVVVIGHHKQSVIDSLSGENIIFAEQDEQLGTGHALQIGLNKLTNNISDVLVAYGDDAILFSKENFPIISQLFYIHEKEKNSITFLTIEQDNPFGLGRIVRDESGELLKIVEEKDAEESQRKIKEINPGCFIFSKNFLQKYLNKIPQSSVTGEYYLTSLIDMAIETREKVDTLPAGRIPWRGINTKKELEEAEKIYHGK